MIKPGYEEFDNPKLAKIYDSLNSLGDDEAFWLNVVENLDVRTIVDFGCGTGLLTCKFAELGYVTVSIDPAKPMIDIARNKPYAESVTWLQGSYEQLGESNTDLITMTSHVAQFFLEDVEWKKLLEVEHRALKQGGYILFDTKNSVVRPWINWSRKLSSRVSGTPVGKVESWVELKELKDDKAIFQIHYLFLDTQEKLISTNELVYRSRDKIVRELEEVGFRIEKIWGDWDGSEFDSNISPEMIFLAKK